MNYSSQTRVPTKSGARYLRQLCSHWGHSLTVEQSEDSARITFPRDARGADWPGDGLLEIAAHPYGLDCRLTASDPAQLAALQGVVASHLDRFAFREGGLAFDWQPG